MERAARDYRVGVFGHYGQCNLGDEAIIEAVIQNLRIRWPTVRVTGFSMVPEDTAQRYGIPAYPIRRIGTSNGATVAKGSVPSPIRDFLKRFALLRTLVRASRFVVLLPHELRGEFVFLRDSYNLAKEVDFFFISGSNQFMDGWGGVWGYPYTLLKWTVLARLAGARVVFLSVGAGPIRLWSRI